MALVLLVSACGSAVRERAPKVTEPAKPAAAAPAAPAPVRVAGTSPTNILDPNARLSVVGGEGQPQTAVGRKVKVALLVPQSGRNASIGQSMLEAAQLAIVDLGGADFELLPYDTQSDPAGAAAAAQLAIANNAELILGPLRRDSTRAVAPYAQSAGIPVISFSNDRSVAGGGVYVMGFVPSAEVDRVVTFASTRGIQRFALLAPDHEYGVLVANAMRQAVNSLGAQLTQVALYDPSTLDFGAQVKELADTRSAQATGGTGGFQALMIAEAAERLRTIVAFLPTYGLDSNTVRLLGTGLWDTGNIGSEPGLAGAWFAAPPPSARTYFLAKYREVYGRPPHRLASLAFDATAMAGALARSVGPAGFTPVVLTSPNGFLGADGLFRFNADGVAQRGLAVLQVTPGGTTVVDPAPRTFQALPAVGS